MSRRYVWAFISGYIITGKDVNYNNPQDIHCAAVIIKRFLRELPEPILTFKLYETIITSTSKCQISIHSFQLFPDLLTGNTQGEPIDLCNTFISALNKIEKLNAKKVTDTRDLKATEIHL